MPLALFLVTIFLRERKQGREVAVSPLFGALILSRRNAELFFITEP